MQSLLVITNQLFTTAAHCQQALTHLLTGQQLLPSSPRWQFVNFPEVLLIDQVRHLQTQVAQSGGQATTIFVLTDFHLTSNVVQNSLLKLLEQPPANVIFILTTNNLTPIISTIRSRCQLVTDHTLTIPDFSPNLTDLDFTNWPQLTSSQLAQLLIDKFTTIHRHNKKTQPDLTMTTIVNQALISYLYTLTHNLHAGPDLSWQLQLIAACQTSLHYLRARVSPKNVLYYFALAIHNPRL